MAGKKSRSDVDTLRAELQGLSEAVWALRDQVSTQGAGAAASRSSRQSNLAKDLSERIEDEGGEGIVSNRGVFKDATGSRQYRWELESSTDDLLAIDEEIVARIMAAIGHKQRLAILKTILNKPTSAADLVTELNLGTTGAAYHHLNVLTAADLVVQESRGLFSIQPNRVSAIFAFLAGVASASATAVNEGSGDDEEDEEETGGKKKKKKAA